MKTTIYVAFLCQISVLGWTAQSTLALATATNVVQLTPLHINQFVDEMRTNHPALQALESRARAAGFGTNGVRTWEDPVFTFGGVAASSRGPKLSEEGDLVYGLEQKLPLFGKPQAARRVAQAEAERETARVDYQFQSLRRDLAKALFKTALADRVVEVGTQDLAWLSTMAATTEERYRAGTASQVELLRIQNEHARRAELLRADTDRREHAGFSVNRLLNRDLRAPLPIFELPLVAAPIAYNSRLVEMAVKFEPKLRVMQGEIQQAQASVAATRKARLPDVSAGIEGRQYSGDGGFREGLFTVSLSLPWFNGGKYRSDLARDKARLEAVELDAADYRLSVREEVHQLTVNIDAARREALLYRDEILPRSKQAIESAHANWLANRGMFNDVMESRRMLLEAQLSYARAVALQFETMAELVLCCGMGDFEALEEFTSHPDVTPTPTTKP